MGGAGTLSSPWVWTAPDNFGKVIRITITFDDATHVLSGATAYRDTGCQWTHIYIGLGTDGTPNSTNKAFTVPDGTTSITANQLAQRGLAAIEDVLTLQITAGP